MPGDNAKKALIDSLNGLLADYFTLYLKTKNYHWHVAGPQFRDLHLLFDEQSAELFALTDIIAERVRKNGGSTLTSIGAIAGKSSIKDDDRPKVDAMDMVKAIRAVKEAATEGMADDWTDQAEQRAWFLTQIAS